MRSISRRIFIGFALWVLTFKLAWAATWLDPSLKWKTLETSHFSIHYSTELEEIAKRFAPMAEEVYEKLTPVLKHKPDLKTNVVLLDTSDYANGYATVFPNPTVTLYLTDLNSNLNPYKYDLWLKFVFLHEYTHILHLDTVEGGMQLFKIIFGRIIFPNALEPWFMIEGMATYMETTYSQAGRGRDPRWEMMMRMDVLEDNVKSLDQAAVDTVQWPMGHLRYLYGVEFLEYLSQTYGEEKLIEFSQMYGDFLFSYGPEGAFLYIFRKSSSQLWSDFLESSREKYKKQKESLGKITEPQLITNWGYYNISPKWLSDSKAIYYQKRDASSYSQIRKVNLENGKDEKIFEGLVFGNKMSLSPDGKFLLFSKADTYKNFYIYKDLYLYDLEKRKLIRLTEGLRAEDPVFSPDGRRIVFVKNEKGTRSTMILDFAALRVPPTRRVGRTLSPTIESGAQYFSPSFSPDGKQIVVAKWTPGGSQKIYLIDTTTGSEEAISDIGHWTLDIEHGTKEAISEANPCFYPGGDYIFFDSDKAEIVNLYAYHLESKRLFQVTNVLGGAMMPDVSPDGKRLAYVSYSSKGYDVAILDIKPSEWKEVGSRVKGVEAGIDAGSQKMEVSLAQPPTSTSTFQTGIHPQNPTSTIHDYNPFSSLTPKFWLPLNYYNENGVQTYVYTAGTDALSQHQYQLQFGYDTEAKRPQYAAIYYNDQFFPRLGIYAFDYAYPYWWGNSYYWERERGGQLYLSFQQNRVLYEWDKQAFSFGFEQNNLSNISTIESYTTKPSLGNINGIFLGWRYLSARSYSKSVSYEDGMDLSVQVTKYSSQLGSDYNFTKYTASESLYIPLPSQHHVLAPVLYGFYCQGDQLEQSSFTWKYLSVRGYSSTHFSGNKGIRLKTEYRFPISYIEKGLLLGYTFFDRLWGNLFFDVGGAAFGSLSNLKLKRGFGAELNLDASTFWGYYGITFKLGYSKGLDEGGEEKIYLTIGL